MAILDWSQCSAVESIPGKVSGAWVFKGTRMPVALVFENIEAGATIEDIMEWFHLTRDQIVAVLEFAARSLDATTVSGGTEVVVISFEHGIARVRRWDTLAGGWGSAVEVDANGTSGTV